MIPRANILAWQEHAPWAELGQVEQDLVLCRIIVELFSDPEAGKLLAFRGGTALHKVHLPPAVRYSEDIDLVQSDAGPAKPVFEVIQRRLNPWLGAPRTARKANGVQLFYSFQTEGPPAVSRRIKIEVNTREHFSVLGLVEVPFMVESPWFSGTAGVKTYPVAELLGTKLRALYQRRKGRDLFDLWDALGRAEVDAVVVVRCFREYLARQGLSISRADFEANLMEKLGDPTFEADARPLLRDGTGYELSAAVAVVRERLVGLL